MDAHDEVGILGHSPGQCGHPSQRDRPSKHQEWLLARRFREILETGELYVGYSTGFSKASSYLAIGCSQCRACLHISLAYMGVASPEQTEAIHGHLANFLICDRALRNSLPNSTACSAERACPGIKHRDRR